MSLSVSLSSAVSSLALLEKQMAVASNNVTNANTQGYSVETVQVAESVYGGVGAGVSDLGTTSNVDQYMLAAVVTGQASSSQATSYSALYQELQTALGQISSSDTGGNDIASQLATVQSDLSTLATEPSDTAQRTQVVSDLDNLLSNLRSVSSQVQSIRNSADSQISAAVTDANTQISAIANLNKQIAAAQAQNQSIASYQDERNTAVQSLSKDLGVSYYVDGSGMMQVYAAGGQQLVAGTNGQTISYTPSSISAASSYPDGSISGIMLGNTDITNQITSGSIAALVQMRDTDLPNVQNSLNALAQGLSSTINTTYNQGSTVPPPTSLSSPASMTYSATDAVSVANGTTIALATMDGTGAAQNYTTVDLTGATTLGDIINDINTQDPNVTASISGGQVVIQSATAGQTIAMTTLTGSVGESLPAGANGTPMSAPSGIAVTDGNGNPILDSSGNPIMEVSGDPILDANGNPVGSSATNLSAFLHFNDLITNGSSATNIQVNPSILQSPSNLATATVSSSGVGTGDGSVATNLFNALNNPVSFNSGTSTSTLAAPANSVPSPPFTASSFTILGGASPVIVTVSSSDTLATIAATINSNAGSSGVTATVIGSGNNCQLQISSGGKAISFQNNSGNALSNLGLASAPLGNLGSASESYNAFATALIADVAARSDAATTNETSTSTSLTALQNNLSGQSGVNVDQQMADITQLQNLYAASAKIISTETAMFSALVSAVNA